MDYNMHVDVYLKHTTHQIVLTKDPIEPRGKNSDGLSLGACHNGHMNNVQQCILV